MSYSYSIFAHTQTTGNFSYLSFVYLQVSSTARLTHWVVRLEDNDIDDRVWLLIGTGSNGAQQQGSPTYFEPNRMYTIILRLHFTTWTFLPGYRIRIAVSNAMFPAFWSSTPLSLPPLFTQLQVPFSDISAQIFSISKPTVFHRHDTDLATVITFKQISYELLPNGCFISALLTFNFTCSHLDPADVRWVAHARQVHVFDMHEYSSTS